MRWLPKHPNSLASVFPCTATKNSIIVVLWLLSSSLVSWPVWSISAIFYLKPKLGGVFFFMYMHPLNGSILSHPPKVFCVCVLLPLFEFVFFLMPACHIRNIRQWPWQPPGWYGVCTRPMATSSGSAWSPGCALSGDVRRIAPVHPHGHRNGQRTSCIFYNRRLDK